MSKIGFACKWIDTPDQVNGIKAKDPAKIYNTGSTTVAWLNRQSRDTAEQKLWDLMVQNLASAQALVDRVGTLDENLRMVRLSSDLLPMYTEPSWRYFWQRNDVRDYCSRHFHSIGDSARSNCVRLSFHPGQFCVLASDNADIVTRSIEEFEYHADMARWMGYGRLFQDFKINVHIAGRAGPEGIRRVISRLSPEARNCLTIENDEITWGLDASLGLVKDCALVLDIHHHWVKTGEYIEASDPRISMVVDSWRGARPVIHYSVSRAEYLLTTSSEQRPCLTALLESGFNRSKLRAHSDFYTNEAANLWALSHLSWADIMCESKAKNLASFELAKLARTQGLFD